MYDTVSLKTTVPPYLFVDLCFYETVKKICNLIYPTSGKYEKENVAVDSIVVIYCVIASMLLLLLLFMDDDGS